VAEQKHLGICRLLDEGRGRAFGPNLFSMGGGISTAYVQGNVAMQGKKEHAGIERKKWR
jgi:hypothetical protein